MKSETGNDLYNYNVHRYSTIIQKNLYSSLQKYIASTIINKVSDESAFLLYEKASEEYLEVLNYFKCKNNESFHDYQKSTVDDFKIQFEQSQTISTQSNSAVLQENISRSQNAIANWNRIKESLMDVKNIWKKQQNVKDNIDFIVNNVYKLRSSERTIAVLYDKYKVNSVPKKCLSKVLKSGSNLKKSYKNIESGKIENAILQPKSLTWA